MYLLVMSGCRSKSQVRRGNRPMTRRSVDVSSIQSVIDAWLPSFGRIDPSSFGLRALLSAVDSRIRETEPYAYGDPTPLEDIDPSFRDENARFVQEFQQTYHALAGIRPSIEQALAEVNSS
jgi:hypothetical protein